MTDRPAITGDTPEQFLTSAAAVLFDHRRGGGSLADAVEELDNQLRDLGAAIRGLIAQLDDVLVPQPETDPADEMDTADEDAGRAPLVAAMLRRAAVLRGLAVEVRDAHERVAL